jgi:hypothetical protein
MASGEVVSSESEHPEGHINNPFSDADLEAKFRGMFRAYGGESQCNTAVHGLWNMDSAADIGDVAEAADLCPAIIRVGG